MQRKIHDRKLSLESLEPRYVLVGELGDDSINVFPAITNIDAVNDWAVYHSPQFPNEPGKSLVVEVRVFGPFSKIAQMEGSVSANEPGEVGRQVLRSGETAAFRIGAFDLLSTLENDGVRFIDLARDRIYGSYVQVTETLRDTNNIIDQRLVSYSLYRYISAVFPDHPQIVFEPTAYEEGNFGRYSNTKTIDLRTYDAISPTFVDPPGRLFDIVGGTGGPTLGVRFWPSTDHSAQDLDESLTLLGGWRSGGAPRTSIATVNARGTVIGRRDWWIDEENFADELSKVFQMSLPSAKAMVSRVLSAVNSGFNSDQLNEQLVWRASSRESADIVAVISSLSFRGDEPGQTVSWFGSHQTEGFRRILSGLSPARQSYELGEMVAEYDADNFGEFRKSRPFVTIGLREFSSANPEAELIKRIVHELGHAIGFTGHVTPPFGSSSTRPVHDVMQQGFVEKQGLTFANGFDFALSQHYLRLFNGIGWDRGHVQKALEYTVGISADSRRITLRSEERGDFTLDKLVNGDDLHRWAISFGRSAEALGPPLEVGAGDANGDSVVDGSDFLIWQQNFGIAATPNLPDTGLQAADGSGVSQLSWMSFENRDEVIALVIKPLPVLFANAVDSYFETLPAPLSWQASKPSLAALSAAERATAFIGTRPRLWSELSSAALPTIASRGPWHIPAGDWHEEGLADDGNYWFPRLCRALEGTVEEDRVS